jgi:hypothetical protein
MAFAGIPLSVALMNLGQPELSFLVWLIGFASVIAYFFVPKKVG